MEFTPQPCDGCTRCCKVMGVIELDKQPNTWCDKCDKGRGCQIYAERPKSCVDFSCAYAQGMMGEKVGMRPDNSKVVMGFTNDGRFPVAFVDTAYPNSWKEGEVGAWFKYMVKNLGKGIVVVGTKYFGVGNWTAAEIEALSNEPPNAKSV